MAATTQRDRHAARAQLIDYESSGCTGSGSPLSPKETGASDAADPLDIPSAPTTLQIGFFTGQSGMEPTPLLELLATALVRDPTGRGRAAFPVGWASTRGSVRPDNQDRLVIARTPSGLALAVLADGMGGMKEGARAAALAVAAVAAHCVANSEIPVRPLLVRALEYANDIVYRALRGEGGAALVMAAWRGSERFIAHAGDARAYVFSEGAAPQLRQLTEDDTVAGALATMGRTPAEESAVQRRLLQYIGMGPDLQPHVVRGPHSGRGLVLLSDGVSSLPSSVIEWILANSSQAQQVAERLVTASEWNGGHDNGTAIVVGLQAEPVAESSSACVQLWTPGEQLAFVDRYWPSIRMGFEGPPPIVDVDPQSSAQRTRAKRGAGERKQGKTRRSNDTKRSRSPLSSVPQVEFELVPSAGKTVPGRQQASAPSAGEAGSESAPQPAKPGGDE